MAERKKKLIGLFVVAAVLIFCIIWIFVHENNRYPGRMAQVRVAGEVVFTIDLNSNLREKIHGKNGIDLIIVADNGSIYVEHSDCPDKICVNRGRITSRGDTIVCLPAQTVVEVI